jgi:hypothetical protein
LRAPFNAEENKQLFLSGQKMLVGAKNADFSMSNTLRNEHIKSFQNYLKNEKVLKNNFLNFFEAIDD